MKTFEAAFLAGETKTYYMAGRFLRVVDALDNSLNLRWIKNGTINGEADLVGSFFAVDAGVAGEDFDSFTIESLSAQTVKFSVSRWAVEAL